jgi:hypothetical protein
VFEMRGMRRAKGIGGVDSAISDPEPRSDGMCGAWGKVRAIPGLRGETWGTPCLLVDRHPETSGPQGSFPPFAVLSVVRMTGHGKGIWFNCEVCGREVGPSETLLT